MPKSVTVTLAGKQYTIEQLPMRRNRGWRKSLEDSFSGLAAILEMDAIELVSDKIETDPETGEAKKIGSRLNLGGIAQAVQAFSGTLLGAVDTLLDLLFAYSPALAADRERIEENAYDDEALKVLVEVLKLAYPFGIVWGMVDGSIAKGRTQKGTS